MNDVAEPKGAHPARVRVLFINDTARNGGPGRSLYTILKFLDPARVHRTVLLPRPGVIGDLLGDVCEERVFEPGLVENPFEPRQRPMERTDFDAPAALKAARLLVNLGKGALGMARVTRLVRRGRYDLIYCNGTNADFAGGAVAWLSGVPALWHVRYTSVPAAVRSLHQKLAESAGVRRIVCVSEAAASLFPGLREKVRVIHNALDLAEFSREKVESRLKDELGLGPDTVVFGSHGRVLRRKGYLEMIEAAERALGMMKDSERRRVRFVVVGDTPEDFAENHLEECRELVRRARLDQHVHFLGFRADVRPYVCDFDVAVVPSVYPDPLPRAVIESMAFGLPVLGFDVGGVREMLADGETGTLVAGDPPDVAGLAEQFVRYFREPELRQRQGRAARARVEQRFDARRHSARIQEEIVQAARSRVQS
jgi:glycosyltransferase involved in cell wall biosynthesis